MCVCSKPEMWSAELSSNKQVVWYVLRICIFSSSVKTNVLPHRVCVFMFLHERSSLISRADTRGRGIICMQAQRVSVSGRGALSTTWRMMTRFWTCNMWLLSSHQFNSIPETLLTCAAAVLLCFSQRSLLLHGSVFLTRWCCCLLHRLCQNGAWWTILRLSLILVQASTKITVVQSWR